MNLSPIGRAFLIKKEGKYPKVYADLDTEFNKRKGLIRWEDAKPYTDKGWPTIGIGHLVYYRGPTWSKDERAQFESYLRNGGSSLTEQQMQDMLDADLAPYLSRISKKLEVPVTQNQFDALVVMAFNTGMGNQNFRLALKETNNQNWQAAAEAIAGGPVYGSGSSAPLPGLQQRRREEAEMYLKDLDKLHSSEFPFLPVIFISSLVTCGVIIYRRLRG